MTTVAAIGCTHVELSQPPRFSKRIRIGRFTFSSATTRSPFLLRHRFVGGQQCEQSGSGVQ